jgi:hypothetical protein
MHPRRVSQRGGERLYLETRARAEAGVVVLIDGIPGNEVVVEGPKLVRVNLPSLPRAGIVDVEVIHADESVERIVGLEVVAPRIDVRTRD